MNDARIRRVIIAGGSGFIGGHLAVELVRRMRAIPSLAEAKFVGMSSYDSAELEKRFDAFLPKPFHPKRLATLLRKVTRRTSSSLSMNAPSWVRA